MHYRVFLFIYISCLHFSISAQNVEPDSVQITNTTGIAKDSLQIETFSNSDTLIIEHPTDSVQITSIDSIRLPADSALLLIDSIENFMELKSDSILASDSIKTTVKTYDQVMNHVRDSLYFEQPDTTYFIRYNLKQMLGADSIITNDTTKQAIYSLMQYSKKVDVEKIVDYLHYKIRKDSSAEYVDTSLKVFRDSVFQAVQFLIKSIPEDSVYFYFKNINRDSVLFNAAKHEKDSVRLKLVDNRGEDAVLWIKKPDVDVFDIYLEDGIYIEKARQQKVVDQRLDADFGFPELKKVTIPNKILPLWKFDGSADIKFSQGYVSESWAEGAESSISTLSILKYSADYSYGKIRNLDTDVEYRLGYLQAGDNELKKNDDKFEINIKYGKQAFNNWYYSSLLNFKTQFFKGKEYVNDSTVIVVSDFLSPAYLVFSLGLDYKPTNNLTVLISPLTSKFTIVADTTAYDQTRYGVGKNEMIRKEIGAYVKVISKLNFRSNISLENKLNFFTNYSSNPQNIDVDWELSLGVQLTDYIKMSINTRFIYDDDVEIPVFEDGLQVGVTKGAQFKELFGIGFNYKF